MHRNEDNWAVFWCSLLGPILLQEVSAGERRAFLQRLSLQEVTLPNGQRKRISYSTLRRKVRRFRQQKIDGLRRQRRDDRGQSRKDRAALLARAVELKRAQPRRSPHVINAFLAQEFGRTIPPSTMNRHLRQAGVTRRKLGIAPVKIRCRWTRDHSNALWVGDFSEGPTILHEGQSVKSHLTIWIDCHSRYVIDGRYYVRENLNILIDSLLRAWAMHGASRQLYVDNAKVFHSQGLRLACATLNIELLHRLPRDPSPGGLVERIIETTQHQFEAEIRAGKALTLGEMNRFYQAWLAADYHQRIHSATGETPRARYEAGTRFHRPVASSEVRSLFYQQAPRTVDPEFSDVRINQVFYAVDAKLRGDRVLVSYDPYSNLEEVRLTSLQGQFFGIGKRYERQRGAHPEPPAAASPTPLDHEYLRLLLQQQQQAGAQQAEAGASYEQARRRALCSLPTLAATLARLWGRQGGVSGLTSQELEQLSHVHHRWPRITPRLLEQAFARAEVKTLPIIVLHLQQLLEERES